MFFADPPTLPADLAVNRNAEDANTSMLASLSAIPFRSMAAEDSLSEGEGITARTPTLAGRGSETTRRGRHPPLGGTPGSRSVTATQVQAPQAPGYAAYQLRSSGSL